MMAIFFTYFIQFYVPMQIMIPPVQKGTEKCKLGIDVFMRTAMVTLTCKCPVELVFSYDRPLKNYMLRNSCRKIMGNLTWIIRIVSVLFYTSKT